MRYVLELLRDDDGELLERREYDDASWLLLVITIGGFHTKLGTEPARWWGIRRKVDLIFGDTDTHVVRLHVAPEEAEDLTINVGTYYV